MLSWGVVAYGGLLSAILAGLLVVAAARERNPLVLG